MPVRYAIVDCPHGRLLVAATERGLCSAALGDVLPDAELHPDDQLVATLMREYPQALPTEPGSAEHEALLSAAAAILKHTAGSEPMPQLPLDVRATAFQQQVWQALRAIPRGETRTYAEIAEALGRPTAARAVARACASNPVALVVPCHRVIGKSGDLSGYRWGRERKAALLDSERGGDAGNKVA